MPSSLDPCNVSRARSLARAGLTHCLSSDGGSISTQLLLRWEARNECSWRLKSINHDRKKRKKKRMIEEGGEDDWILEAPDVLRVVLVKYSRGAAEYAIASRGGPFGRRLQGGGTATSFAGCCFPCKRQKGRSDESDGGCTEHPAIPVA
jgi:hypothetical protein